MERFHFGSWRLDLDPRCAWKKTENTDCQCGHTYKKGKLLNEYDAGGLQTSWTIQTEAITDQQVPVPQHSPQQVSWAGR